VWPNSSSSICVSVQRKLPSTQLVLVCDHRTLNFFVLDSLVLNYFLAWAIWVCAKVHMNKKCEWSHGGGFQNCLNVSEKWTCFCCFISHHTQFSFSMLSCKSSSCSRKQRKIVTSSSLIFLHEDFVN
jgi:hypothetical protein